jgi:hypothetical protein
MDRFGPSIALPLALFAPNSWKKEIQLKDVHQVVPYPEALLSAALSTKSLGTVCEVAKQLGVNAFERQVSREAEMRETNGVEPKRANVGVSGKKYGALDLLCIGSNPKNDGGISSLVSRIFFRLQKAELDELAMSLALERATEDSVPAKEALIHPVFPGLHFGNGGLRQVYNQKDVMVNSIMSVVCNRLMANALIGSSFGDNVEGRFEVQVESDQFKRTVTTLEDLMEALEDCGHTVDLRMTSNITSMGVGMCVKDANGDSTFAQIPLAYPLATGLVYRKNQLHKEAVTLMTHGAMFLRVRGPIANFHLEWCLNVTGTTSFQPVQGPARPWQQDSMASVKHASNILNTKEGRKNAFRYSTVISVVTNCTADLDHVVIGGYGYLGVCLDSVAAIQQALTGECTLYPLFLGGAAKMSVLDMYRRLREEVKARTGHEWEYSGESIVLSKAIRELPCDILTEPTDVAATAQRALHSLPERSIFVSLRECKTELESVIDMCKDIGV